MQLHHMALHMHQQHSKNDHLEKIKNKSWEKYDEVSLFCQTQEKLFVFNMERKN